MAMKLGIITDPNVEGIKWAADKGLHYAEFCYNVGNNVSKLEKALPELEETFEKYDVKLGSLGRWGADKIKSDGKIIKGELEDNLKLIDIAARLGCPVFNTGVNYVKSAPYLENIEYAKAYLSKVVEYGKSKNVKVALYNCDWNNFCRTPNEWKLLCNSIPGLGIKYDPSHCINSGSGKYLEEINDWGDKIYHFHLKGTLNIGGDHVDDPPVGLDMVNWRAVLGLLYAKGYDGMLSIEPHSSIWKGDLGKWGIDMTIKYVSEMIYQG